MTRLELLPYECTVCHAIFRSWFEIVDDNDKKVVNDYFDNLDAGVVFTQIKNERKCRRCRKSHQLEEFNFTVEEFDRLTRAKPV